MQVWTVLKIQPVFEKSLLKRIVLETYAPKRLRMISHARRVSWEPRPLFPGYIFVHADLVEDRWQDVQRLSGAVGFIRFGRLPSFVEDDVIHALRRATDGGAFNDHLEIGDRVKVTQGPFEGMLAKIADLSPDRAILELLQCTLVHFVCGRDMISAVV